MWSFHVFSFQLSGPHSCPIHALTWIANTIRGWDFNLLCYSSTHRKRFWFWLTEISGLWLQEIRVSGQMEKISSHQCRVQTGVWSPELFSSLSTFFSSLRSNHPMTLYSLLWLKCSKIANVWLLRQSPCVNIWLQMPNNNHRSNLLPHLDMDWHYLCYHEKQGLWCL